MSTFPAGPSGAPQIPLVLHSDAPPRIDNGAEQASLTAGDVSARVDRKSWKITFEARGRVLTTSGWRGMAHMQTSDRGNHVVEQFSLGVGEYIYGLGERFTAFVKNGQVVEIVNKDGGRHRERTGL